MNSHEKRKILTKMDRVEKQINKWLIVTAILVFILPGEWDLLALGLAVMLTIKHIQKLYNIEL